MDQTCIFCRIAAGLAPAFVVEEDDRTMAFMDINPVSRGHVLVVPRQHSTDLLDIQHEDLTATAATAQRVAIRISEVLHADGFNLLNCSGTAAWQTVFHFHIHVIPRYRHDGVRPPWPHLPGDLAEIAAVGEALARQLT